MQKIQKKQIREFMDADYKPLQRIRARKSFSRKVELLKEKSIVENHHKWSTEENIKYVKFLAKNKQKFVGQDKTKRYRIFNKMALHLKTRNATQCRTHHQKMLLKYKTLE